jgi:hypothetical protein
MLLFGQLQAYADTSVLRCFKNSEKRYKMSNASRISYLHIALIVTGLALFGIYPMTIVWPSGWAWGQGYSHYLMMFIGVYATLGVFLLVASQNPLAHKSLIWFTVCSSAVHAGIMAVQALSDVSERGHLVGNVPVLFLVAVVLGILMPRDATLIQQARLRTH